MGFRHGAVCEAGHHRAGAARRVRRQGAHPGEPRGCIRPQGLHQGEVSDHAFYQPVIHVAEDGQTAHARIRELSILGKYGVEAYIGGGTRENQYVKENGVWRIKSDHLYLTFLADYEKGWAHGALPAPGPSKTLPPDRPPSVNYCRFRHSRNCPSTIPIR